MSMLEELEKTYTETQSRADSISVLRGCNPEHGFQKSKPIDIFVLMES